MRIDQPPLSKRKPVFFRHFLKNFLLVTLLIALGVGVYLYGLPLLGWHTPRSPVGLETSSVKKPVLSQDVSVTVLPPFQKKPPLKAYAQPFESPPGTHNQLMCVVFLNEDEDLSKKALAQLPKEIGIALDPTIRNASSWAGKFYQKGHEIIAVIPLEPENYPLNDPGDHTLLTQFRSTDMAQNIKKSLEQIPYTLAVTHRTGTFFTAQKKPMHLFLNILKTQGMAFFDPFLTPQSVAQNAAQTIGLPALKADYTSLSDPLESLSVDFLNKTLSEHTDTNTGTANHRLTLALSLSEDLIADLSRLKEGKDPKGSPWVLVPFSYALRSKEKPSGEEPPLK